MPNKSPNAASVLRQSFAAVAAAGDTALAGCQVLCSSEWEFHDRGISEPAFWARGPVVREPFESGRMESAFRWLLSADWLDALPAVPSQMDSLLIQFLTEHGAVTLKSATPHHNSEEEPFWGPDGHHYGSDGMPLDPREFLLARGYRTAASNDMLPRGVKFVVPLRRMLDRLVGLRRGLLFSTQLAVGNPEGILTFLWKQFGLGRSEETTTLEAQLAALGGNGTQARFLAKMWFQSWLDAERLQVAPFFTPDAGPLRLRFVPTSPAQSMFLAQATAAGVFESPYPLAGIYVCDYHRCPRRVFLRERAPAPGVHKFCSPECGKRFHAMASTYRKRGKQLPGTIANEIEEDSNE